MADITAIILTKNEEVNIGNCIQSIKPIVKRIIVVDSFSTDKTKKIASGLDAEVYEHEFINYSQQFAYGLHSFEIRTKWVLRIDADESLTKKSRNEIEKLCNENVETDINGIVLRFEVSFMGKKLRHGGIYPFKKLSVFKYGIGEIENKEMDEHIILKYGKIIRAKEDSIHKDYKNLTTYISKHNEYSSREVNDYLNNKISEIDFNELSYYDRIKNIVKFKVYYCLPMGLRAYLYYFYRYYIRLGFLDGKEGKIFAFLQAYWYRFLVDAKIYERQKEEY